MFLPQFASFRSPLESPQVCLTAHDVGIVIGHLRNRMDRTDSNNHSKTNRGNHKRSYHFAGLLRRLATGAKVPR